MQSKDVVHRHLLGFIDIPPQEPAVVSLRQSFENAGAYLQVVPMTHRGAFNSFDAVVCFVDISDHPTAGVIRDRAKAAGKPFAFAKRKKAKILESLRRGNICLPFPERFMDRHKRSTPLRPIVLKSPVSGAHAAVTPSTLMTDAVSLTFEARPPLATAEVIATALTTMEVTPSPLTTAEVTAPTLTVPEETPSLSLDLVFQAAMILGFGPEVSQVCTTTGSRVVLGQHSVKGVDGKDALHNSWMFLEQQWARLREFVSTPDEDFA